MLSLEKVVVKWDPLSFISKWKHMEQVFSHTLLALFFTSTSLPTEWCKLSQNPIFFQILSRFYQQLSKSFMGFMLFYEHITGALTYLLSALAFYFLVVKTPKHGRRFSKYLMLLQVIIYFFHVCAVVWAQPPKFQFCVTAVDFNFGILLCPVLMFPAPAAICRGLICEMGFSGHIGQVFFLLFDLAY